MGKGNGRHQVEFFGGDKISLAENPGAWSSQRVTSTQQTAVLTHKGDYHGYGPGIDCRPTRE